MRAGVPVAGPGAVLPLPLPKRGAGEARALRAPTRRPLGCPVGLAFDWFLLGQSPAWGRK